LFSDKQDQSNKKQTYVDNASWHFLTAESRH